MTMNLYVLLFVLWVIDRGVGQRSDQAGPANIECGYKQCPQSKEGALNVHIVAHSHMDAGWVKTFDEYYYGTNSQVSAVNVQLIYHSVLSELLHDNRRKFTLSESGYFWRWWREQRPGTRRTFRSLVRDGRVEFAGGGYVQNDEATAHYTAVLDQYTWGLRKLNDTLGPCGRPKVAWQIDTYGHSREMASLVAQMGFDGLFLGRVDYRKREAMMEKDRMESLWRGSDVLGRMSDVMTHTLHNLYNAPDGFCFDFLCSDEPIADDPTSPTYNAEKRAEEFVAQVERQASYYDSDNIIVTMGGDFTYQSAASWYINIDKLMSLINGRRPNGSDVHVFYSTPSCYLKAVYLRGSRQRMFLDRGDHLPYASDDTTYWSGFYSSRPTLKYMERVGYNLMQVTKQLAVLTRSTDSVELHQMRHAMALLLHHDAITGTSQQHVIDDFVRRLSRAMDGCREKSTDYLAQLTASWLGARRTARSDHTFVLCHQLNISRCPISESADDFLVVVYNPLSEHISHHVRLPVATRNAVKLSINFTVLDADNTEQEHQLTQMSDAWLNKPGLKSSEIQELWFEASVPPLGYTSFRVGVQGVSEPKEPLDTLENKAKFSFIANQHLKVSVNKDTGLLQSIKTSKGLKVDISQNFLYYAQTNSFSKSSRTSGAYCFRPHDEAQAVSEIAEYQIVRGPLVKEIRQRFSDWLSQVVRLYRGAPFVELEWTVGPVPIGSDLGKEVVSRFHTNLSNSGEFYTDSNGRQMMRRTCVDDSVTKKMKPLASCYYPVTSRVSLRDQTSGTELVILTDRAQGATSYREGELELMIQRRLLTDDGFGLEEPLDEHEQGTGVVVRGTHRILIGNYRQHNDELSLLERAARLSRHTHGAPSLFLTSAEMITPRKWRRLKNKKFTALKPQGLSPYVHILTLEPWRAGSVLLRLENTLEGERDTRTTQRGDSAEEASIQELSIITVDLRQMFQQSVTAVRETTLAANQWLDEARQMDWSNRFSYDNVEVSGASKTPDSVTSTERKNRKGPKSGYDFEEKNYDEDVQVKSFSKVSKKMKEKLNTERSKRSINYTMNGDNKDSDEFNITSAIEDLVTKIEDIEKSTHPLDQIIAMEKEISPNLPETSEKYDILRIIESDDTPNFDFQENHKSENLNQTSNAQNVSVIVENAKLANENMRDRANETKIQGTPVEKSDIVIELPPVKRLVHENNNSQMNTVRPIQNIRKRKRVIRRKKMAERSNEIDDGVTRPMFDMYNLPNKIKLKKRINYRRSNMTHTGTDNSRNLRRLDRDRAESYKTVKSVNSRPTKERKKAKKNYQGNDPARMITSGEELPVDDVDDDLEDFLKNLKKIEAIADALEDVIPKSNLAKLRAQRRKEEIPNEYSELPKEATQASEQTHPKETNFEEPAHVDREPTLKKIYKNHPSAATIWRRKTKRAKRDLAEQPRQTTPSRPESAEEVEEVEVDKHVISLRPTQIRTFVIYFD